jgi:UDP-N-acetylglucosamine--dolichyl-phosphate N-acetylglucosaminephosphotransferase
LTRAPYLLLAASVLSFISTYLSMPYFIRFMFAAGIVGRDVMKPGRPRVADMGGPGVVFGLLTGVFFYIGVETFIYGGLSDLIYILAAICTVLIITLIGIFDVLTALMREREGLGLFERLKRKGIPDWVYYLAPIPAAVPLMAVNAGVSSMSLPLIGRVELGFLYPLVLVPLAILCCSNATNFLAGFNGLEAGMGAVLHLSLGLYALLNREYAASAISLSFASSLLAFLRYNWYPAKVFPGDLNYTIGAVAASVAIIGNMEKFSALCFSPWILEAFLKLRSRFKAESFGILLEDGTLKPAQEGVYSLTHIVMRLGGLREWQVSLILIIIEAITCITSYLLISYGIV